MIQINKDRQISQSWQPDERSLKQIRSLITSKPGAGYTEETSNDRHGDPNSSQLSGQFTALFIHSRLVNEGQASLLCPGARRQSRVADWRSGAIWCQSCSDDGSGLALQPPGCVANPHLCKNATHDLAYMPHFTHVHGPTSKGQAQFR